MRVVLFPSEESCLRALTLQNPTAYKKGVRKIVLRQFFPGQVWNDALMNNAPCVDTRNENDKTTNRVGSTADCKKKNSFCRHPKRWQNVHCTLGRRECLCHSKSINYQQNTKISFGENAWKVRETALRISSNSERVKKGKHETCSTLEFHAILMPSLCLLEPIRQSEHLSGGGLISRSDSSGLPCLTLKANIAVDICVRFYQNNERMNGFCENFNRKD